MSSKLLITLLIPILAATSAFAAPNFTGKWKLNIEKSDFGQMPPPTSMTRTVAHDEPKLKVSTKQSGENGDFEFEANYTTDGKECSNEMFGGNVVKSTLKWDGDVLVIESKGKFGDNDFTMTGKWSLSADGKTLTENMHFASSMGEGDSKLVMEKQ